MSTVRTEKHLLETVAKSFLSVYECQENEVSEKMCALLEAAVSKENELLDLLGEKEQKLLMAYSEALTHQLAHTADEHFIAGFIEGYKFFERFLEKEKEKIGTLERVEKVKCPSCQEAMTAQIHFSPENNSNPKLYHICSSCLHAFSKDLSDKEFKNILEKKKASSLERADLTVVNL